MLIYALRLLKRNGGVASVQWVYVPTRPKWTIRRGCWRKGSGNCGPGWGQKEEGTDAEQDYYCQESAATPTYGHGLKSFITCVGRLINSLPTSSRNLSERAEVFSVPWRKARRTPFALPSLTNGYPGSRLRESRAEGVRTRLAETAFASFRFDDSLRKEYATLSRENDES